MFLITSSATNITVQLVSNIKLLKPHARSRGFPMTICNALGNLLSVRKFCGTSYLKVCIQCSIFQTNLGEDETKKMQSDRSCLFAATHWRQHVDWSHKQHAIWFQLISNTGLIRCLLNNQLSMSTIRKLLSYVHLWPRKLYRNQPSLQSSRST